MKCQYFVVSVASIACYGVFAADINDRLTQLETQMSQVRSETVIPSYGAKNPTDHPDHQPWKLSFDILYWHPKIDGTTYAYTANSSTAAIPLDAAVQEVSMNWDWGFRAGIGYNFEDEGDLYLQYTYFNEGASSRTSAMSNSTVVPLKGYPNLPSDSLSVFYCLDAASNVAFDFETLDLLLRHGYFVNKRIMLRPSMGLKAAWIDIDQNSRFSGGSSDIASLAFGLGRNTQFVKDINHFEGVGPMFAVDFQWFLRDGFSISGDINGALVFGRFHLMHKEEFSPDPTRYIRIKESFHRLSPMAGMRLGVGYDVYPRQRKNHLGLFLGYEAQFWFKQNITMYVQGTDKFAQEVSQSLDLYGVTFDIMWEF